jgi:hypothetical protein
MASGLEHIVRDKPPLIHTLSYLFLKSEKVRIPMQLALLLLRASSWLCYYLEQELFFFFFFETGSPDCPGTHSIDQAGLKLRNLPVFASQVLGLKACAITARQSKNS